VGLGGQLVGGFGWANGFGFFLPPLVIKTQMECPFVIESSIKTYQVVEWPSVIFLFYFLSYDGLTPYLVVKMLRLIVKSIE
jgi:hypothetical protein